MSRAEALAAALAGAAGLEHVVLHGQATGGMSQETWFATVRSPGREDRPAVLRLPTPGSGTRAIGIQRAALQLAHAAGAPVPDVLAYDDGAENPLGAPFLVMERSVGEIPPSWSGLPEPRRTALAHTAAELLAGLHAIDVHDAPPQLRRPKENAAAEELAFYRKRLAALGVGERGTVEVALRWLEAHVPPPHDLVLVHNDFRMGNFVVDGGAITAVLDWELAALGHPAADLSWLCIAVWEVVPFDFDGVHAAYGRAGGPALDPAVLRWYTALGYLRILYFALAGGAAFMRGASPDLRQAVLRLQVPSRADRLLRTIAGEPLVR